MLVFCGGRKTEGPREKNSGVSWHQARESNPGQSGSHLQSADILGVETTFLPTQSSDKIEIRTQSKSSKVKALIKSFNLPREKKIKLLLLWPIHLFAKAEKHYSYLNRMRIRSHLKCESGVLELFLIECPKHKCKVIKATNCIEGEVSAGANQNVE